MDRVLSFPRSLSWVNLLPWLSLFSILALTLVVLSASLDNPLLSDDWVFLYRVSQANSAREILGFLSFNTSWFVRPTQWLLTWGLYQVAGISPPLYHLVSLSLHGVNALLLAILTFQLVGPHRPKHESILLAGVASLFFLTNRHHPDAVFWYAAINELLVACFKLLALLLAINAMRRRGRSQYAATVGTWLACGGALLSKESAVVLNLELVLFALGAAFLVPAEAASQRQKKQHLVGEQAQQRRPLRDAMRRLALLILPCLFLTTVWAIPYVQTAKPDNTALLTRSSAKLVSEQPRLYQRFAVFVLNYSHLQFPTAGEELGWIRRALALVLASIVVALLRRRFMYVMALAWIVLAALPYLYISWEGQRYLYTATLGTGLATAVMLRWVLDEIKSKLAPLWYEPAMALLLTAATLLALPQTHHLYQLEHDWDRAGRMSMATIQSIATALPVLTPSDTLCVLNLPRYSRSTYLFHQGFDEAIRLTYGHDDFTVRSTREQDPPAQTPTPDECTYIFAYKAKEGLHRLK